MSRNPVRFAAHATPLSSGLQSDIAAMLARKQAINAAKQSTTYLTMERSRLQQERTLAMRRQDYPEVKRIDEKLAELNASLPSRGPRHEESASDNLAKINERNRRLNQEQVRMAERMEMERKRRERQLRAGTATPTGGALDAAARLKAKMLANGNSRLVLFRRVVSDRGVWMVVDNCLLARMPPVIRDPRLAFLCSLSSSCLLYLSPHLVSVLLRGHCGMSCILAELVRPGHQQLGVRRRARPLLRQHHPVTEKARPRATARAISRQACLRVWRLISGTFRASTGLFVYRRPRLRQYVSAKAVWSGETLDLGGDRMDIHTETYAHGRSRHTMYCRYYICLMYWLLLYPTPGTSSLSSAGTSIAID